MKTDIIIPVHNRPEHTFQTITSLYKNTDPNEFDLYVVNDKSEKETSDVLWDLHGKYKFHYHVNQTNIGPGSSRNLTTQQITKTNVRGDFLYHSDNDVFFTKDWLFSLLGMFVIGKNDGVKVLGGSCHPYLQNNKRFNYPQVHRSIGIKDAVSGYSQLMEWETWNTFGPFDTFVGIMGSEDWKFCQDIIKAGFLVGSIEPEVVIPCGKTNTYGNPATGSETFKNVEGVIVK